ncbi:Putative auto-transporter adhesin, head GIN domain [Maribacter orientalis]|uniref:Putative auto-transporter adhesin, head GIN domain n=1 Tax=Maribacter orientalis TaxID=228957 RepID=A0A1H7G5G4_9FLAO|nr:head GIN domain-containing protein [Maribacter orientalis]SEK33596.1 Putative auto-transporter adhesin, head GIN domain [Maribacter orientalis]
MTTLVRITIALVLALLLNSCGFDINFGDFGSGEKGNGVVVEETREITEEFTEVSASEGIDVFVTQGSDFDISVEADENIMDLIGTDIRNGKLKIHAIENIGRATKKVYVTLPKVSGLIASSGSHLTTENMIQADKLQVDASSGAIIDANVKVTNMEIDASSGANISLEGTAKEVFVDGSSGANIKANELQTLVCNADASSGANISIDVTDNLTAEASSGGNISYKGNPSVQKNKSVSGSVHKY